MSSIIEARVKQKKDTLANWNANPLVLLNGEQAFVVSDSGQPINFKIGDGTKTFAELPFWIQYDQAAFVPVSGLALPTPTQEVAYTILGEGTYTHTGGDIVVPDGHWGIASWDGSVWSFSDMGDLPLQPANGEVQAGDARAVSGDVVFKNSVKDIYNVTELHPLAEGTFYTSATAKNAVPVQFRRRGLIIKYSTSYTNWVLEQFVYEYTAGWGDSNFWVLIPTDLDLKRVQTNPFFKPTSNLINYNLNSIIEFGRYDYEDNGDNLYLGVILKTPSLIQVFNQSNTLIGQYYNPSVSGSGIQEVEIKSLNSNTVLFKAIVNWDIVREDDNLQKQIEINLKHNYTNDLPRVDGDYIEKSDLYEKSINLFDKNDPDVLEQKWIPSNSTTGVPEDISLVSILTGFVDAGEGNTVYATIVGKSYLPSSWFAVFDENKNIITKSSILQLSSSNNNSYTMQPGERYIRFATRESELSMADVDNFMVTVNQQITQTYYPYGITKKLDLKNTYLPMPRFGQRGVLFADSIGEFSNWTNVASEIMGCEIINCAIGGTRMAKHQVSPNDYDAFSPYNLVTAIVSGDWSRQITAANNIKTNVNDDNTHIVARMASIDWSTIDFIILAFGTNDLTGGNPIGNDSDNTGNTIKGAMNIFINGILTAFPKIEILGITPIYREVEGVSADVWENGLGIKMANIIQAEEEIYRKFKIEYLTSYHTMGINNLTLSTFTIDGTHLSEFGAKRYGTMVARKFG